MRRSCIPKQYPYWILKRSGLRVALRSWGVAPGVRFSSRLEEQHGEGEVIRHKIASRLWLASLKESYKELAEVWAGWTEVSIPEMRLTPDALAWGKMEGRETLFWCEVESGHLSTQETAAKLLRRLRIASRYANQMEMKLVFGVLTVPVGAGVHLYGVPRYRSQCSGDLGGLEGWFWKTALGTMGPCDHGTAGDRTTSLNPSLIPIS